MKEEKAEEKGHKKGDEGGEAEMLKCGLRMEGGAMTRTEMMDEEEGTRN